MTESERTVNENARSGDAPTARVCGQLLADHARYSLWLSRHERQMHSVAARKQRERQTLVLRSVCVEQIHRAALVRYLRDHRITGELRDLTLREFYNVTDSRESALIEHRNYLVAASSQLCAAEILGLVDDRAGVGLLRQYELAYGQYFGMFCERARVLRSGGRYLLAPLLPEVREAAERIRLRILNGDLLRARVGPQRVGTLQHKPALRVEKSRPALRPSVPPKRAG